MKIIDTITEAPAKKKTSKVPPLTPAEPAKKKAAAGGAAVKVPAKKKVKKPDPNAPEIIVSTNTQMIQVNRLVEFIRANCQPWLAATKNGQHKVYRGVDENITAWIQNVRSDRSPKDTNESRHHMFNAIISRAGGIANRSNAAFVSGDKYTADTYGTPYVIFPIGDFRYTWSPEYADWTNDLESDVIFEAVINVEATVLNFVKAGQIRGEDLVELVESLMYRAEEFDDSDFKYQHQLLQAARSKTLLSNKKLYDVFHRLYLRYLGEISHVLQDYLIIGDDTFDNILAHPKLVVWQDNFIKSAVIADRDLIKAIGTEHEIMIACDRVLGIDPGLAEYGVIPVLQGKKPNLARIHDIRHSDEFED